MVKPPLTTVGHVPRTISSICLLFLRKGGKLSCKIAGSHQYSCDLPQGGLDLPYLLVFEIEDEKVMNKVSKLLLNEARSTSTSTITNDTKQAMEKVPGLPRPAKIPKVEEVASDS